MDEDPFYEQCCITGETDVEWHHALIFAGQRVNRKFCILPVSKEIHRIADRKDIKEKLNWIMLNRASESELIEFSKAIDYRRMKVELNKKYGTRE